MDMDVLDAPDIGTLVHIDALVKRAHIDIAQVMAFVVEAAAIYAIPRIDEGAVNHIVMLPAPLDGPGIGMDVSAVLLGIENSQPLQGAAGLQADQRRAVLRIAPGIGEQDAALVEVRGMRPLPDSFQSDADGDGKGTVEPVLAGRHDDRRTGLPAQSRVFWKAAVQSVVASPFAPKSSTLKLVAWAQAKPASSKTSSALNIGCIREASP